VVELRKIGRAENALKGINGEISSPPFWEGFFLQKGKKFEFIFKSFRLPPLALRLLFLKGQIIADNNKTKGDKNEI